MELRHMRYFVAVAEALSFRKAAARLHVSAPTLSVQIADLEERLAARLLERDTSRVRLTVAGEVFLAEAKRLLDQAQLSMALVQEAVHGRRGTLRIGNAGAMTYGFLPACLNLYRRRFPDVEVTLVDFDAGERRMNAIAEGEVQIGFGVDQDHRMDRADFSHHPVLAVTIRVFASDAHPMAGRKKISLKELAGQQLLAYGRARESEHAEFMISILTKRGIKVGPIKRVAGIESFMTMLAGGIEVSLLPHVQTLSSYGGLAALPLREKGPDLQLQLHAIWRSDETSVLVKNFVEVLRRHRASR